MHKPLLQVKDLSVTFSTADGDVPAVDSLSFYVNAGETLGIVGESGSGKSQAMLALMGLLASNGRSTGTASLAGTPVLNVSETELQALRGNRLGMVFQDPMTCLNPYLTVGKQMAEVLRFHRGMGSAAAKAVCVQMLDAVKIPQAERRLSQYPHEFSGGMRQRIMIAMALLCQPELLIADEPTTALDVTVQAGILALLRELQQEFGMGIILITHDLGVAAGLCERIQVMYGGRIVETGPVEALYQQPQHPYTRGLLDSVPRLDTAGQGELLAIPGNPPDPRRLPPGCAFSPRCSYVMPTCIRQRPTLSKEGECASACHLQHSPGTAAAEQEAAEANRQEARAA